MFVEGDVCYNDIKNSEKKIVIYNRVFDIKIINDVMIQKIVIKLSNLMKNLYKEVKENKENKENKETREEDNIVCILLEDNIVITNKGISIPCKKGDVVIFGSSVKKGWRLKNENGRCIRCVRCVEDKYLSVKNRLTYADIVFENLKNVRELPVWNQCIQEYIKLEMIGKGSYGNVYRGNIGELKFAVKFSKVKEDAIAKPYSLNFISWYEVFFLKEMFRPLIKRNICPNLPLLYDSFTCDKYKLILEEKIDVCPCVVTVVELANGDFKDYLNNEGMTDELIYSSLFQIMAGLCAIQKYFQIWHYDIKKQNILFYKIEKGGYFQYTIRDTKFYVPNHGYLFVINDFGISRSMSPKYPMYRSEKDLIHSLGSRYAFINDGIFVPINIKKQIDSENMIIPSNRISWGNGKRSMGAEFRMSRETAKIISIENTPDLLSSTEFFENPEIVPPFEFYNDTQDVIRIFTGGKRTTQKGFHKEHPNVPKNIIEQLKPYLGKGASMKDKKFSIYPNQLLASYFILDFFKKYTNYTENISEKDIIGIYEI
jgi:serine/threonine protein kinase